MKQVPTNAFYAGRRCHSGTILEVRGDKALVQGPLGSIHLEDLDGLGTTGQRDPSTYDHPPCKPSPREIERKWEEFGLGITSGPKVLTPQALGQAMAAKRRADAIGQSMVPSWTIEPRLTSRYLVKGWIDRGTLSVVYGESNVGKTFFALDLAMHVAEGKDWHGNRIRDEVGRVIYIAAEGGAGIFNRIAAIRRNRPDLMASEGDGNFILLPTALDLLGETDAQALLDAIREYCADEKPDLIVIDTLAMTFGGGDENTSQDMGKFVNSCTKLRAATGAHVMVIHHSGKDTSKGARGSNSLRAATDTEIELTRDGAVILATQRKQRDMPTDKTFAYTLRGVFIGTDEDGDDVTSAVVEPTDAPARKRQRLTGQALIAMQAFGDALKDYGVSKTGEDFPQNRKCVSLDHWKEACNRHGMSHGDDDSTARQAFRRAWRGLQQKGEIRVLDGFAWRCSDA